MHTARIFAVYIVLAGCGPTTVNVTTTGEGDGEESSGPIPDASTSPGATSALGSESSGSTSHEPMDTSTGRGDASSGTTGDSSTTGGDEPPVCVVPAPDVCVCNGEEVEPEPTPFGCFCGDVEMSPDACCLPFEQADGSYACFCYGEWVDSSECMCFDGQEGCECPGFETSDKPCLDPPIDPCMYDADSESCECDGIPSDPSLCDCVPVAGIPTECACDGFPAPAEFCAMDCVLVGEGDSWSCTCDGDLADPAACGCPATGDPDCICAGASCGPCVPIGAMCLCGDFVAPPEAC